MSADVSHLRVEGGTLAEVYTPINDSILRSLGEIGTPLTDLMAGELAVGPWAAWTRAISRGRRLHQRGDESVLEYLKIGHESFMITVLGQRERSRRRAPRAQPSE